MFLENLKIQSQALQKKKQQKKKKKKTEVTLLGTEGVLILPD